MLHEGLLQSVSTALGDEIIEPEGVLPVEVSDVDAVINKRYRKARRIDSSDSQLSRDVR